MAMSSINPFSGYLAQGSQTERAQAAEKARQIRRSQELSRNIARQDDSLEHQVESTDTVTGTSGEQKPKQDQRRKKNAKDQRPKDGEPPHVDVTA
jgi:hypothetical protein